MRGITVMACETTVTVWAAVGNLAANERYTSLFPSSAVNRGYSVSYMRHQLPQNKIMSKSALPFLLGTDECSLIFKLKLMLKRNIFCVCISLHF